MFLLYLNGQQEKFLTFAEECYRETTRAFMADNVGALGKMDKSIENWKRGLKNARRKETLCLRQLNHATAIEKSTWFYLGNNSCMSMLYNLRRINEICKEHVENNFNPLPKRYVEELAVIKEKVTILFNDTISMVDSSAIDGVNLLRRHCDEIKDMISDTYHSLYDHLREGDTSTMTVLYVYLNVLQETQEMVSGLRKYLRAYAKMISNDYSSRKHMLQAEG